MWSQPERAELSKVSDMSKEKILYLNLKGEYFDQIKSGDKKLEYRLFNFYWKKRLLNGLQTGALGRTEFSHIVIRRGYPKAGDPEREIIRPWKGFDVLTNFTHPHFGINPVSVFAIIVN